MKKLLAILLVVTLALSIGIIGCNGGQQEEEEEEEPIKIGAIYELTGTHSWYGTGVVEGIELRLDEANYEVAGKPIEFIVEDNASDPDIAVDKVKKLVELDKIDLAMGPVFGHSHWAIAGYLTDHNIMGIFSHGTDWDLVTEYPEFFIAFEGPTRQNFAILGDLAYDEGYRTMATIGMDYSAGYNMVQGVVDRFEAKGGTIVSQQWAPFATADYTSYLITVEESEADVLMFNIWMPDILTFLPQYYDLGVTTPWLTRVDELTYPVNLDPLAETIVGGRGMTRYPPSLDLPEAHEFNESFFAKYGRRPYEGQLSGYIIMSIYLAGLERTGGDPSREAMWQALQGLQLQTPKGLVTISCNGMCVVDQYMVELKLIEGEYVWDVFATYPQSSLDPRDTLCE
ncbi:MAG: ABC transporter substrate-binding protein [Chloroflexota bacterium]